MYSSIHSKFIKAPISDILKDGVNACCGVGYGIEAYPLCDYVMQSLFLKMTGAQEQKLKCICWEMATNDYDYRYAYLNKVKSDYGDFSTYDQKNNVYKQLINEIKAYNCKFEIENFQWIKDMDDAAKDKLFNQEVDRKIKIEIDSRSKNNVLSDENKLKIETNIKEKCNNNKNKMLIKAIKNKFIYDIKNSIASFMEPSILPIKEWRNYSFWKKDTDRINSAKCALKGNLLAEDLKNLYENDVIRHRHRCAHNLMSYQQNLPTLNTLAKSDYNYHNYFFRFAILILIDEIFMRLYTEYIEEIEHNLSNI